MDRHNQFLEPERGIGMVGWAVKQLVVWSIGGLVVYSLVANRQLFGSSPPATAPEATIARPSGPPSSKALLDDGASGERLRPLGQPAPIVTSSLMLRAQSDGHVVLNAEINGATIRFLVDTGATWVSLTHADALRAGVGGSLNYSLPVATANGPAKAAPVTLRQVRIGQLEVNDVAATVMPEENGLSLLGQSFLKRLQSYQMRGDVLTLTWQ